MPESMLFVGRLNKDIRTRDLEKIFEPYGKMARCEIKYGAEMAYAFIDFDDRRDAEDAMHYENGREVLGNNIVVEWAKGTPRRNQGGFGGRYNDECYKCHRPGHQARECTRGVSRRSPSPYGRRSRSPERGGAADRGGDRGRRSGGSRRRSRSR